MARYLYHCLACRQEFEIEKAMSLASSSGICPNCGQEGQRVFTVPAIGGRAQDVNCGASGLPAELSHECAHCSHADECELD
jgi:putative FmdB family regulatory protein